MLRRVGIFSDFIQINGDFFFCTLNTDPLCLPQGPPCPEPSPRGPISHHAHRRGRKDLPGQLTSSALLPRELQQALLILSRSAAALPTAATLPYLRDGDGTISGRREQQRQPGDVKEEEEEDRGVCGLAGFGTRHCPRLQRVRR